MAPCDTQLPMAAEEVGVRDLLTDPQLASPVAHQRVVDVTDAREAHLQAQLFGVQVGVEVACVRLGTQNQSYFCMSDAIVHLLVYGYVCTYILLSRMAYDIWPHNDTNHRLMVIIYIYAYNRIRIARVAGSSSECRP